METRRLGTLPTTKDPSNLSPAISMDHTHIQSPRLPDFNPLSSLSSLSLSLLTLFFNHVHVHPHPPIPFFLLLLLLIPVWRLPFCVVVSDVSDVGLLKGFHESFIRTIETMALHGWSGSFCPSDTPPPFDPPIPPSARLLDANPLCFIASQHIGFLPTQSPPSSSS